MTHSTRLLRDFLGHGTTRRAFLRGAGACMALPWLESVASALRVRPTAVPVRMAVLVMPNGALPSAWDPAPCEAGGFEPSFSLEPLRAHRSRVTVFRNLANRNSFSGDGHYAKVAPLLTGQQIRRTGGRDLWNGVSADQVAASFVGRDTLLPSLELACDPVYPVEDMGYSSVYGGHIAWSAPDRPVSREIVPRNVFDRLFRSRALAADPARKSVLDVVKADAERLAPRLGKRDRDRLVEYLDAVRALELRIEAAERAAPMAVDAARAPAPGVPAQHETHVELMTDLVAMAFGSDCTRVATFLLANEVSGRDFSWLEGCKGGYHDSSHHENDATKMETYRRVNRFYVARCARLLDKLAALPEAEGTVLDHSRIVFAGAMKDGNAHSPHDLPVLLAGPVQPSHPGGRLLVSPRDTPLCRLWLGVLQDLGAPVASFGDATERLG
ncbi:MAG: hypothetical protein RL148_1241 [Planctomycetota bacterium]